MPMEIPLITMEKLELEDGSVEWVTRGQMDYVLVAKPEPGEVFTDDEIADIKTTFQNQWESQLLEIAAKILEKWDEGLTPLINRMTDPEKWWKGLEAP